MSLFSKMVLSYFVCLATKQKQDHLHSISRIEEVFRLIEIMENLGVVVRPLKIQSNTPARQFNLMSLNKESNAKIQ